MEEGESLLGMVWRYVSGSEVRLSGEDQLGKVARKIVFKGVGLGRYLPILEISAGAAVVVCVWRGNAGCDAGDAACTGSF